MNAGIADRQLSPFARIRSDRGRAPWPNPRVATMVAGSAVFVWATAASLATIGLMVLGFLGHNAFFMSALSFAPAGR